MWQLFGQLAQLGLVVFFIALGFIVGSVRERRHFKSLQIRESQYSDMILRNVKVVPDCDTVKRAMLVSGEAVIASDYFKSFAARLRNIVGGEMKTYETLMSRARREATLRMMEHARAGGAKEIWNIRYETSNIRSASGRYGLGTSVEVFAFGTAVVREQ